MDEGASGNYSFLSNRKEHVGKGHNNFGLFFDMVFFPNQTLDVCTKVKKRKKVIMLWRTAHRTRVNF